MFGKRPDGRRLKTLAPIQMVMPYVMKTRSDSMNMYEDTFDCAPMDRYIQKKEAEGLKVGYMHILACHYYYSIVNHKAIVARGGECGAGAYDGGDHYPLLYCHLLKGCFKLGNGGGYSELHCLYLIVKQPVQRYNFARLSVLHIANVAHYISRSQQLGAYVGARRAESEAKLSAV